MFDCSVCPSCFKSRESSIIIEREPRSTNYESAPTSTSLADKIKCVKSKQPHKQPEDKPNDSLEIIDYPYDTLKQPETSFIPARNFFSIQPSHCEDKPMEKTISDIFEQINENEIIFPSQSNSNIKIKCAYCEEILRSNLNNNKPFKDKVCIYCNKLLRVNDLELFRNSIGNSHRNSTKFNTNISNSNNIKNVSNCKFQRKHTKKQFTIGPMKSKTLVDLHKKCFTNKFLSNTISSRNEKKNEKNYDTQSYTSVKSTRSEFAAIRPKIKFGIANRQSNTSTPNTSIIYALNKKK